MTVYGMEVSALVAALVVGIGSGLATLRAGTRTGKAIGDTGASIEKLARAVARLGRDVKQLRQRVDAVAPPTPAVLARQGRGPVRARRRRQP